MKLKLFYDSQVEYRIQFFPFILSAHSRKQVNTATVNQCKWMKLTSDCTLSQLKAETHFL